MARETIGGTSPDRATIAAWVAALPATLTEDETGAIRAGTYDESAHVFDMTAGSWKVRLEPDTGADDHAGVWKEGVRITKKDEDAGHVFQIDSACAKFEVEGVGFYNWVGDSGEAIRIQADAIKIERCIFGSALDNNADAIHINASSIELFVSNCFFAFIGRAAILCQGNTATTVRARNLTAIFCEHQGSTSDPVYGSTGTSTSSVWDFTNVYGHMDVNQTDGDTPTVFFMGASGAWTGSSHNSASDTTAPGTSTQDNIDPTDFMEIPPSVYMLGENTTRDDFNNCMETTYIRSAAQTTNYSSDNTVDVDFNAVTRQLWQFDMSVVGAIDHLAARLAWKISAEAGNTNVVADIAYLKRKFTLAQATWNIYKTSNNWHSAGADGADDIATRLTHDWQFILNGTESQTVGSWQSQPFDWLMVQNAIDGAGLDSSFLDWFGFVFDGNGTTSGATDLCACHDEEASTQADRPYLEVHYGTPDPGLASGGTGLLDNGTSVSGDSDYPVSVDITGATRAGTWDIGAYQEAVETFDEEAPDDIAEAGDTQAVDVTFETDVDDGAEAGDTEAVDVTFEPGYPDGAKAGETVAADATFEPGYAEGAEAGETLAGDLDLDASAADGADAGDLQLVDRPLRLMAIKHDEGIGTWLATPDVIEAAQSWDEAASEMQAFGTWPPAVAYEAGEDQDGIGGSGKITPQNETYTVWADGRVAFPGDNVLMRFGSEPEFSIWVKGTNGQSCRVYITGAFGQDNFPVDFDGNWNKVSLKNTDYWRFVLQQYDWDYAAGVKPQHQWFRAIGMGVYFYLFSSADPIYVDHMEGWFNNLSDKINELTVDDTTYAKSSVDPVNDRLLVKLAPVEGASVSSGTWTYRYGKEGSEQVDITSRLWSGHPDWAGATLVKEVIHTDVAAGPTQNQVGLSGGELANIVNPQGLWHELIANAP
jgi:hypothetical protein